MDWTTHVRFWAVTTHFSLLRNVQTGCGVHTANYSMGTMGFFHRAKAASEDVT